jgi:hypothetical protein
MTGVDEERFADRDSANSPSYSREARRLGKLAWHTWRRASDRDRPISAMTKHTHSTLLNLVKIMCPTPTTRVLGDMVLALLSHDWQSRPTAAACVKTLNRAE